MVEVTHTVVPPKPFTLAQVLALTRIAVDYHRLGYGPYSEFDADTMVHLMDQLGYALDNLETKT